MTLQFVKMLPIVFPVLENIPSWLERPFYYSSGPNLRYLAIIMKSRYSMGVSLFHKHFYYLICTSNDISPFQKYLYFRPPAKFKKLCKKYIPEGLFLNCIEKCIQKKKKVLADWKSTLIWSS